MTGAFGIDVSYAQGVINWPKLKADGVEFAIIKASQGRLLADRESGHFQDPTFERNVRGAAEAGIQIGVYHYLTAETADEAAGEAEFFLRVIEPHRDKIDLWAVCDVEEDKYLPADKNKLGEIVNTFLQHVREGGFSPMIYTNPNYLSYRLPDVKKWPLWLAYWGVPEWKAKAYEPVIWQYGGESVGGLNGVDANRGYFDAKEEEEKSVTEKEWWEDALEWAQENGIIYGDENGDLMLDETCTRRQMIVFLHRVYELIKGEGQK